MATNLHKLLLFIFAALLVAACDVNVNLGGEDEYRDPAPDPTDPNYGFSEPVTEYLPGGGYVTFQYKDEATIVKHNYAEDGMLEWIEGAVPDTILFKPNTPANLLPRVGDILLADISPNLPFGLRHVVVGIEQTDDNIRAIIKLAALEDCFEDYKWDFQISITDSMQEIVLDNGETIPLEPAEISNFGTDLEDFFGSGNEWGQVKSTRSDTYTYRLREPKYCKWYLSPAELVKMIHGTVAGLDKNIELPEDIQLLIDFLKISDINAELYFSFEVYSKGNIKTHEEETYIEPGLALNLDFSFPSLSVDKPWHKDYTWIEKEWNTDKLKKKFEGALQRFAFMPLLKLFQGYIPAAPGIVIAPSIHAKADIETQLSGSYKVSSQVFKVSLPIKMANNELTPLAPIARGPHLNDITIDGKVGIHFVPELTIGVGLYTDNFSVRLKPTLNVGGDLDLPLSRFGFDPKLGWSEQTKLNNIWLYNPKLSLSGKIKGKVEAGLFAPISSSGMKIKDTHVSIPLPDLPPLFTFSWPLLPMPVENSLQVQTFKTDPPSFHSVYRMDPGVLGRLSSCPIIHDNLIEPLLGPAPKAGIRIRQSSNREIVDTYYSESEFLGKQFDVFNAFRGLHPGINYYATPILNVLGKDWEYPMACPFTPDYPSDQQPKLITHIGNLFTMAYDAQGRVVNIASYAEGLEFFELDYDHMTVHYENDDEEDTFVGTFQVDGLGRLVQIDGRYPDGETQSISFTYNAGGYIERIYNHFSEGDSYTNNFTWKGSLLTEVALIERSEGESDLSTYKYTYTDVANRTRQYVASLCMNNNFWWPVSGLLGEGPARLPAQLVIEEDGDSELLNITYTLDDDGAVRTEYIEGIALNYTYTTDGTGVKASAATLPQHPQLKPSWHRSQVRKSHP